MKKLPTKDQIENTRDRLCYSHISEHVDRLKQQDAAYQALQAAFDAANAKYEATYLYYKGRRDRLIDQAVFGQISAELLYTAARDFFDGSENGC